MEQATNQFTKGLQSDTHPMVQGNDTLTDCLNGTLITMNGNEVILQNDMGNRRVDNAFLPAGYEPVGIKEYGGIIYVAAYNPITNRSQIGSFPSPERKISKDDIKDGLSGTFDFASLNQFENKGGIKFLKNDTILVPLTAENVLHAGDKFVVYSSDLSSIKADITNYDNTDGLKVKSPKNKKYTLSLGILNSQNEFVDITKTLCRWNGDSMITYDDNTSDLYKFNKGYFIASSKPSGLDYTETTDDRQLQAERRIMPANTYAYKLIGPLYLKAQLNCIQDFSYEIDGYINGNQVTLQITGYITYNCPDWITETTNTGDDNYKTYEIGTVSNGWFDFIIKTSNNEQNTYSPTSITGGQITYDPNTNLYSAKVIKTYTFQKPTEDIINYTLGVLPNSEINAIYLENLSQHGIIDISKLSSGEIKLTDWRFSYSENQITLTFGFETYPRLGETYSDLKIIFTGAGAEVDSYTYTLEYNKLKRSDTIKIDNLQANTLYKAKVLGKSNISGDFYYTRWVLTTSLMNTCYSSSSIRDYGNPTSQSEKELLNSLLTLKVSSNLDVDSSGTQTVYNDNKIGEWIKQKSSATDTIDIINEHTCNLKIKVGTELKLEKGLYPSQIYIEDSSDFSINPVLHKEEISENEITYSRTGTYRDQESLLSDFVFIPQDPVYSNQYITGKIIFKDKFKSTGTSQKIITHPYGSFEKYLKKAVFNNNGTSLKKYGGIGLSFTEWWGSDDIHYLDIYYTGSDTVIMHRDEQEEAGEAPNPNQGTRLHTDIKEGPMVYTYQEFQSELNNIFNREFENQLCFYIFEQTNFPIRDEFQAYRICMSHQNDTQVEADEDVSPSDVFLTGNARVWFKTTTGWALFKPPYKKANSSTDAFWNFLKTNLFKNKDLNSLVYCFAESINCAEASLIGADNSNYIYNNKYTINVPLDITVKINSIRLINPDNVEVQCEDNQELRETIKFQDPKLSDSLTDNISIELKSPDSFREEVESMLGADIDSIYLDNPTIKVKEGGSLNPGQIYELSENTLSPLNSQSLPLVVDTTHTYGSNYYGILWNSTSTGSPTYRYDFTGWHDEDDFTLMDYSGVVII